MILCWSTHGGTDEFNREMDPRYISCVGNNHDGLSNLLSLSRLLHRGDMRTEYGQRCYLVGDLASLLGDPMELAEVARTPMRILFFDDVALVY